MRNLFSFLAAASLVMVFAGQSLADSKCHEIEMKVTTSAVDPMLPYGKYAGTALVRIDEQAPIQATVSLAMVEVKNGDDGKIYPTNAMTFDFGSLGTLSVQDKSVLTPTETPYIYTISSRLDNLTGTGAFVDVIGRLMGHGQLSFATTVATVEDEGRICW